ncbi:SET domain-containing protein 5 [Diplogelasinospora grovesii]|uniref:SET domain-containing protein 5 n=1 Tax=Diplogelasinospora grovesii TaxID=303347 RepID=A0AAN6N1U8_9PEZI|nr:SET domain-containing protein 5 [Diplogelasinospora grovesii]
MVGFPALLGKIDVLNGGGYTDRQRHLILQRAVNQLPPDEKREVMALARSTGGDPIQDIIKTNGFGVEVEGVPHMALFTVGSRVNHNCRPNVFWRYSKRHMAMEVVALREIQAGEEVAHSYAPLGYTRAERQEMLRAWGFECRCAMWAAPAEHVALSDSRRERLFEIHHTLSSHASEEETDGERLIHARVDQLVSEALTLIAQEELHPQVVVYCALFARAYMAIGDLALARKYVALSEENWILYGGEEHDNVDGIRLLWEQLAEAEADVDD